MSVRAWLCLLLLAGPVAAQTDVGRLRLIVETDAGGDPDDEQSLVRFLVYASEFDVEGIIANRPKARDGENRNPVRTGLGIVERMVRAYGECLPRLRENDPRYPTLETLLARTVPGDNDHDEGVELIIKAVDADDPRPVWFLNWGTDDGSAVSCLHRALDRVLKGRGREGYAKFKSRIRLSSDDCFGPHTYEIAPPFPIWVDTFRPEQDRRRWYHRFSALTATAVGFDIERDVRTGHGPLGAMYPLNTTHKQKEGDTMSFLYLVPTGMNDPDQPGWGSWAGRYGKQDDVGDRPYYWANLPDAWNGTTHRENTLARWAVDLQNDFRARMDWCVTPFADANHPPKVTLSGPRRRTAKPGERIPLAVTATDSDDNRLTFSWQIYPEPGRNAESAKLENAESAEATLTLPGSSAEVHVVLTVRDNGSPPLARYARVVVKVESPRGGTP